MFEVAKTHLSVNHASCFCKYGYWKSTFPHICSKTHFHTYKFLKEIRNIDETKTEDIVGYRYRIMNSMSCKASPSYNH